jgi:hypothetical protein
MSKTKSKQQLEYVGGLACAELDRQGRRFLERNWRCRLGTPICPLGRQYVMACQACRRRDSPQPPKYGLDLQAPVTKSR